MTKTKRKIANVAMVILIVSSGTIGMAGNASATHECSTGAQLIFGFSYAIGQGGTIAEHCNNGHVETNVEEVRDAEETQDKVDLYTATSAQKEQSNAYNVLYDNYLQDTETVAWSKAEAAIVESYANGTTKAEAKVNAKEEIAQYYAIKQINLIKSWNTSVTSGMILHSRSDQEGFEHDFVDSSQRDDTVNNNSDLGTAYVFEDTEGTTYDAGTEALSLANGSEMNSRLVQVDLIIKDIHSDYNIDPDPETFGMDDAPYEVQGDFGNYGESTVHGFAVKPPNSNYERTEYLNVTKYSQKWSEIETKNSELQNESDVFVDSIWQDLVDENINSTDVLSRNTLMFEYGTASAGSNGTYYDAIGAASGMGLETPDLNGTGQMQITIPEAGNTYYGMVFARTVPNGSWESGKTYNPDNFNGPVMIADVEGELFKVERNFTIDKITNKEGEEQESATTVTYNYQTADTSELNEKYDELLSLTQELQERIEPDEEENNTDDGSGGTVSPIDEGEFDWLFKEYFNIPAYGFVVIGLATAYIITSARNN